MAEDRLGFALKWVDEEALSAHAKQGGHDATYKVACTLANGFDLSEADMEAAMNRYNDTKCFPPWSVAELRHKVKAGMMAAPKYPAGWLYRKMARADGVLPERSANHQRGPAVAREPIYTPKWKLDFDMAALRRFVDKVPSLSVEWFKGVSPIDPDTVTARQFLEHVFLPGEKVIVFTNFTSQGQFGVHVGKASYRLAERPGVKPVKSDLPDGGPDGVWYLANPVDGEWHLNPRSVDEHGHPRMSRRSEESVVTQRHMVIETDIKDTDHAGFTGLWMQFLARLPLPVLAIYTSGGKSWHALVKMDFPTKRHLDVFKQRHGGMLSKLGADARAWSPTQLTRLPGCMRGNRRQELLYLNPRPDPAGVPILEGGNACG